MSYALINTNDLTTLGNAIRAKTGDSNNLSISEMATAVNGITIGSSGFEQSELIVPNAENYMGTLQKFIIDQLKPGQYLYIFPNSSPGTTSASSKSVCAGYSGNDLDKIRLIGYSASVAPTSFPPSANQILPVNIENGFYNDYNITKLPDVSGCQLQARSLYQLFYNCNNLPDTAINNFTPTIATSWNNISFSNTFYQCKKIQNITPFLKHWFYAIAEGTGTANALYTGEPYYGCSALQEAIIPVGNSTQALSNRTVTISGILGSLKKVVFLTDRNNNNAPYVRNMTKITVLLSQLYNWNGSESSGPKIYNEASYTQFKDRIDSQAYDNSGAYVTIDGVSVSGGVLYNKFNHNALVELINSLPDASASVNGSTSLQNKIKISKYYGKYTDEGGVDTLTASELEVATNKGWTVELTNDRY